MFKGHDAILAVDIGGTNIRAGLIELDLKRAPDLSEASVHAFDLWRHADEAPTREQAVQRLIRMLKKLIAKATKDKLRLAPFIGVGCPGVIASDGSIERGAQNFPGNWESSRFNLPAHLIENIPRIEDHRTTVVMHNDAVLQGLSEVPFMLDVERWGVLTIGTGLGNARFTESNARGITERRRQQRPTGSVRRLAASQSHQATENRLDPVVVVGGGHHGDLRRFALSQRIGARRLRGAGRWRSWPIGSRLMGSHLMGGRLLGSRLMGSGLMGSGLMGMRTLEAHSLFDVPAADALEGALLETSNADQPIGLDHYDPHGFATHEALHLNHRSAIQRDPTRGYVSTPATLESVRCRKADPAEVDMLHQRDDCDEPPGALGAAEPHPRSGTDIAMQHAVA